MDYETVSVFARTWGVVYLILLFVGVCVYAFWPRNKDMFDRAAQTPLDKDEP
jgi:cytochrome c oxidase cbb3-type subunit 4